LEKVYQFGGKFQENIREGAFEGEGKITLLATFTYKSIKIRHDKI